MNRILVRPIFLEIRAQVPFGGIRDVHFSHVYAKSARMPFISGRADCPIENVTFSDCRFTQMPYEEMGTFFDEYKRLIRPHRYKVDLSDKLCDLKKELTREFKKRG